MRVIHSHPQGKMFFPVKSMFVLVALTIDGCHLSKRSLATTNTRSRMSSGTKSEGLFSLIVLLVIVRIHA